MLLHVVTVLLILLLLLLVDLPVGLLKNRLEMTQSSLLYFIELCFIARVCKKLALVLESRLFCQKFFIRMQRSAF